MTYLHNSQQLATSFSLIQAIMAIIVEGILEDRQAQDTIMEVLQMTKGRQGDLY